MVSSPMSEARDQLTPVGWRARLRLRGRRHAVPVVSYNVSNPNNSPRLPAGFQRGEGLDD
jgi:hypothetical protein